MAAPTKWALEVWDDGGRKLCSDRGDYPSLEACREGKTALLAKVKQLIEAKGNTFEPQMLTFRYITES